MNVILGEEFTINNLMEMLQIMKESLHDFHTKSEEPLYITEELHSEI